VGQYSQNKVTTNGRGAVLTKQGDNKGAWGSAHISQLNEEKRREEKERRRKD
jgi:hypothetical protein